MQTNLAALVCFCEGYSGAMPQCDQCQHQDEYFDGEENHLVCKREG